jgi:hypothetical protein
MAETGLGSKVTPVTAFGSVRGSPGSKTRTGIDTGRKPCALNVTLVSAAGTESEQGVRQASPAATRASAPGGSESKRSSAAPPPPLNASMLGIQDETDDDAQPPNISAHANTPLNRTMTQYPKGGEWPLPHFPSP